MFSAEIEKFIKKGKYPTFRPKAIFFDMDGVLFDSMKSHASAWVEALRKVGLPFTEYEAYLNEGRTGSSTIDVVFSKVYGRNATDNEKQTIYQLKTKFFEACQKPKRMPYVFELLKKVQAQKLEIFVVTGSGQSNLIDSLETHFPGVFNKDKMVTAYEVKQGKPHPEPYLKALKKSGFEAWEVIVIENAPLGIESATKAGLFSIGVNTGPLESKILTNSGANLVFNSVKKLYEQWEEFCNICN